MTYFRKSFYLPKCKLKKIAYLLFCILICVLLYFYIINSIFNLLYNTFTFFSYYLSDNINFIEGMKYILLWNVDYTSLGDFSTLDCPIDNCIFITNQNDFSVDPEHFDAVIFDEHDLTSKDKPVRRLRTQIYIFASRESSHMYPACDVHSDGFYNWTYTYRLDSDIVWSYFVVRNRSGDIVAPGYSVDWKESSDFVRPEIKSILRSKKNAAAWLVSNCKAGNQRNEYLKILQEHLFHYSLKIDIYGECSKRKCGEDDDCSEMIKNNFFFYMAFENSFTEDYVTEKVLHGYNNYAVPIVYGDANYTRFLPPGSYINARHLHPYTLASLMHRAIMYPEVYEDYFKWRNLYSITRYSKIDHSLCELCAALNEEEAKFAPAKTTFRIWWNGLNGMKWCLPPAYWNETVKLNTDFKHVLSLY